jgi:hypothetical protein
MARSKIDKGEAGSRGEARAKRKVVFEAGCGGERKGLIGETGDIERVGERGD